MRLISMILAVVFGLFLFAVPASADVCLDDPKLYCGDGAADRAVKDKVDRDRPDDDGDDDDGDNDGDDGDDDKGHGNDDDGNDDDNPGKGWGKGGRPGNPGKGHDK